MVSIRYQGLDAVRRAVPHGNAAELDCVWYAISQRCSSSGFGRRGRCAIIVPVQTERHRSAFAREKADWTAWRWNRGFPHSARLIGRIVIAIRTTHHERSAPILTRPTLPMLSRMVEANVPTKIVNFPTP